MVGLMIKSHLLSYLAVGGLVIGAAGLVGYNSLVGAPNAMAQATQPGEGEHERHPEIHKALHHLREAKHNLELGAHDFQGHRADALKLTDQAIEQCELALKDDVK